MPAPDLEVDYETITVETDEHVCTITLNRPAVSNAMNERNTTELQEALKKAERHEDVRVIILTGAGNAFCSGQDLGELRERYVPGYVPHFAEELRRRYEPIIERICEMEKPVIAAVNGVAAGAGCSLALACDLCIASEDASFIEAFINVGLAPDSGSTYFLPRLVGYARAMELCCTARPVSADEAARIGLVNRVVPPDKLLPETRALAATLTAAPARGIALTKLLLRQSFDNDLSRQLEAEDFAQETAGQSEDHLEGVAAFLEKRKPHFKGR